MAMANVANVGLSLNPATKYAYLVPRDGAIQLDISYIGLIKIATDAGSIKWARADVVREGDNYVSRGVCEVPIHEKPKNFGRRGDVLGVYCIAKTWDGDYLVEEMDIDAINEIRETSKAKNSQYSPWNTFFTEMCKKTVIKRASKTWPKTDRMERLDNAIHVINEHEGLVEELPSETQYKIMADYAERYGKQENEVARISGKSNMTELTCQDATKTIQYINKVKALEDSVEAIKSGIQRGDTVSLFECLSELNDDEYSVITKAPTKGGPLSVDERKYIMSDEWRAEIKAIEEMQAEEELDKEQLRSQQ
jgi:recombinational DNA repair protein RecT